MFYLINKLTNEVEAENEKKGPVRKLYKLKEDKDNWSVSKYKQDEAPVKKKREKATGLDDELKPEQEKKLEKLYADLENPGRDMTGFQTTTTLMPDKATVLRVLQKKKAIEYRMVRHSTGQWFAFYDTEDGKPMEPAKSKKERRKESKAKRKEELTNEEDSDIDPGF